MKKTLNFSKLSAGFLAVLLCFSLPVQAEDDSTTQGGFTDVPAEAWYAPFVTEMVAGGYVTGRDETTYAPNDTLSIAEFTVMITNAFYGETLAEYKETSKSWDKWWTPFFQAANARGGLANTKISAYFYNYRNWDGYANVPVTRFDVAAIIANLVLERGGEADSDVTADLKLRKLPDYSTITMQYHSSVATVLNYGLMAGRPDGSFDGNATLTRGEAAVVLSVLVNTEEFEQENLEDFYIEPDPEAEEEQEEEADQEGNDTGMDIGS